MLDALLLFKFLESLFWREKKIIGDFIAIIGLFRKGVNLKAL